ncbi:KipI antagonist [Corynebacterium ciconiae DSM 44920]|uniref:5-oxoprolinase subunit C family protein n=1 Tax=Corynebacterium ciconiae TaxID=227319 RepID=UPI000377AF13|nr:biotin-dependent carboxyltransferase family protein [Corynebacterium ciconiae]WKD61540.1 KipI antagonist [Corynebacterium ciconiae DSM 44920]
MSCTFDLCSPGALALIEDCGRFGYASVGVSQSGVFDRRAAAQANHAVGNHRSAAVIELLGGGFSMRARDAAMVVLTGTIADVLIHTSRGMRTHSTYEVLDLSAGDILEVATPRAGLRSYVAVRGGWDVAHTLGSASHDVLSGMGPAPLAEADVLTVGHAYEDPAWWPRLRRLPVSSPTSEIAALTLTPGPRDDWFDTATMGLLLSQRYTVTAESNRVGVRLCGDTALQRCRTGELPSEGMVRGSIQIPPNGQPVIFGPDHPVTGGYPVIAVLTRASTDRLAQLAPGDSVHFALC